jgi:hypothetical protein
LQPFLQATKTILDNLSGANGAEYAAVIQGDLAGAIRQSDYVPPTPDVVVDDDTPTGPGINTPPPKLTGLYAIGGFSYVFLAWDEVPYGNSAYTVIYRNSVDDWETAEPIGTSRVLVYQDYNPNFQEWYYWITTVSVTDLESPPNAEAGTKASAAFDKAYFEALINTDAVISSVAIKDAAILDAHIYQVGADKIFTSSLAAITANLGTVSTGEMRSPDGTFVIDLTNKEIVIAGPNGQNADDYTLIQNGRVETWEWTGSTHQLSKSLKHIEVGVANSGDTVVLPGYFEAEPAIIVSPRKLRIYDASYSGQDQDIYCAAENVEEITPGSGSWQFTAVARIELGDNYVFTTDNDTDTDTDNAMVSGTYTTPANTTNISVNLSAKSVRGTGTAPNYYKRKVTLDLEYRESGTSDPWDELATTTVYFGSSIAAKTATLAGDVTSGTWDFRVSATFADDTGTFAVGSGTEPYTARVPESDYATDDEESISFTNEDVNTTKTVQISLTGYSKPSDVTITSVKYYWKKSSYLQFAKESANSAITLQSGGDCGGVYESCSASYSTCSGEEGSATLTLGSQQSKTYTTSSWGTTEQNYIKGTIKAEVDYSGYGTLSGVVKAKIGDAYCEITGYTTLTNSSVPSNELTVVDHTCELSGAVIVASGTLNWMAVR